MVGSAIRVLVVDDDPDHRALARRRLTDAGIHVTVASSASEALGELDDVDLVLLDYRLPGMSGLDALAAIRDRGGPSVVMLTGMGSESVAVEAMRAGAIDYVTKDGAYLRTLPQIVERAWRTHDLTRRAGELQRVALLVTSAAEREAIFAGIVEGARRLLGAETCALFVTGPDGLALEAVAGEAPRDQAGLRAAAAVALARRAAERDDAPTRELLVALPSREGDALGVLAVLTAEVHTYLPGELDLARTFASFAGLALANLQQHELEQSLVAELQEMLDLRRELVASVSHELRTPLTCISGFAGTLDRLWESIEETDRRRFVNRIRHHSAELTELVEGLLDFSAAEAGRLSAHVADLELRRELEAAVEEVGPLLAGRPMTVECAEVRVSADPTLLRRTVWNLLSNAVKYSEPGTPITVRARVDGDHVLVEVADRGVGLSPAEAAQAFDPFWRAQPGTSRSRGTGIGLALVRDYVRLMGGDVGVRSQPAVGSTFFFSLPLAGR
ncbi:MAG: two-component system, OmpR family, sensor histidine kinase KdpD [Actinomycetota bacterium]|jgi:signal transduction histidine kinase